MPFDITAASIRSFPARNGRAVCWVSLCPVNLRKVLQRRREVSLKLTLKKCKFRLDQVPYVGHLFTKEGLKPDEAKVKAIKEIPPSDNPEALYRLLGMINYKNSLTWAILVSIRIKSKQRLQTFV